MLKPKQLQRLLFLFAVAGLFAVTADFACLDDVCAELRTAEYRTMDDIRKERILTLDEALAGQGLDLSAEQKTRLRREGRLTGLLKVDRPVKHPDGTIEMPKGWLPEIPEGHPWRGKLTPSDDAFYSFVEERIFRAKLFDPANPEHVRAAEAYLAKAGSKNPEFVGWTYAQRTECRKKVLDARGVGVKPDAAVEEE
jgi:hypothetical protein